VRASKRRARSNDALDAEAAELTSAIRGHGYDHVTVKADRGFLYVDADGEPLVRLKPLSGGSRYGLSFHHHSGRWDPTPFTGGWSAR
jgi:hypothetical protein